MDKLKIILADLKKYQFWILCGIVLVVSLVCWWLATSGTQFNNRKKAIDGSFTSARIAPEPPNQAKIKQVKDITDNLKQRIYPAWETLYKQQNDANRLPEKLGKEFKTEFEKLKPGGELASQYREIYQTYIRNHLPSLRKIIRAMHPVADADDPAAAHPERAGASAHPDAADGAAPRPDEDWNGIVEWDDNDFRKWEDRFRWDEVPTTTAVVLAQEDLWVCEALLRAIDRANQGASNQGNAVIKRIDALEIAASALEAWKAASTLGLGAPGAAAAVPVAPAGATFGAPGAAGGATTDETVRQRLFQNRYVDDKGTPLAYDASSPLFVRHPFPEFKIMPIYMKLVLDRKQLPKLLVECANSQMPMEIRRLHIQGAGEGTAAKTAGSATMAVGAAHRGGPSGGRAAPATPAASSTAASGGDHAEVPVEIYAILYIFNPPDAAKLGKEPPAAQAAAGAAAAGMPPAATPTPGR